MSDQDERDRTETQEENASVDEAVERMEEHDAERGAARKQGQIHKENRRRGLDDG